MNEKEALQKMIDDREHNKRRLTLEIEDLEKELKALEKQEGK